MLGSCRGFPRQGPVALLLPGIAPVKRVLDSCRILPPAENSIVLVVGLAFLANFFCYVSVLALLAIFYYIGIEFVVILENPLFLTNLEFLRFQPIFGLAEHAVGQSGWQPFPFGVCDMFIQPESWGLGRVKMSYAPVSVFPLRFLVGEPLGRT